MAPSSRYYEDKRQREEERRQRELERRKEEAQERMRAEEKERLREEERREEARREALEFEATLEQARLKREEMLTRLRLQKRIERKETDRQMKRREDLLSALREANRGRQREEGGKEGTKDSKTQQKETAQAGRGKEITQEQKDKARREAKELEERRKTALEKAREAAAADRRKALEQLEKSEARKKTARDEIREQAIRARLEERKELDKASVEEERRRAELLRKRNEEQTNAGQAEERRGAATAERNEKDREAEKGAERREEARREKLEEQRRQREKGEREAERREQLRDQLREQVRQQRSLEKEIRQKSGEREEQPKRAGQAAPEEKETARSPLESRLPSGVLSGSLPWLLTYDNEIVTTEGEIVLLRGINLPDMEALYAQADPAAGTGTARLHEAVAEVLSWGATIVRLGFKPGRLIPSSGSAPASDYLERIDNVITRASAGNCYTALYPLAEPGEVAGAPYLSNLRHDDVVACLRALADRYASEPAVLLDLGCAPGDLLADETPSRQAAWAAWIAVVPNLVADLRLRHPRAFCFVGGLDKGADVAGFPATGQTGRPIPGLAYTASLSTAAQDALTRLRHLAAAHPVFVSEWGGRPIDMARDMVWDAAWGERMAILMDTMGIGWAASFGSGDAALLRPVQSGRFTLTPFGAIVKRALVRANARAETSTLARFSITM